jgi:hypothetical protein
MLSSSPVQRDEVSAIARQDGTAKARREGKLVRIRDGLVRKSSLKCRQDIVANLPQPFHNGKGKVLVRVKPGHDTQTSSLYSARPGMRHCLGSWIMF